MRTPITFVLLTSGLVSLGLMGCGGDETTDIPDTGTDSTNPGNDSSVNNDSSTNDDGSTSNDGSSTTDGPVSTGDGGSTPGTIQCGSNTCNSTNQECCIRFSFDGGVDGGAGVTRNCIQKNGGQCLNGVTTECDEKADCPQNEVCCLSFSGGGTPRGQCQQGCGGNGNQLCKTTQECTNDGGVCTVYTCANNQVQSCRKPFPQCTP